MEQLSTRVKNLEESATIAMAQKARELKQQGIDIISLSLGEPDFKTPQHIQDAAKQAIDDGKYFAYPPVPGYQDLREAISAKLKRDNDLDYSANQIVVSTGAKQCLANVFLALLNPGDEVVIVSPYWVSYADIIKFTEGVPVLVKGDIANDYKPTADQIEAAITNKTKAIIYSSPSNPTGSVFTDDELSRIAEVVKKHQVFVIADEIYEYINFTGGHSSIGAIDGMQDLTITINGFSKGFAMTGWRLGYLAAPLPIAKACAKIQGQFTSGANTITQRAALAGLNQDLAPTHKMAEAYKHRRDLVFGLLNDIPGIKNYLPQGAFYFFPDISAYFGKGTGDITINNASDMSMYLLNEANVSVVTGEAFGSPENIRISYAASEEDLVEAMARIKNALAKLN